MKIVFLTGKMCSGKTTYTERYQDESGNEVKRLHVGEECRRAFGDAEMAESKNPTAPSLTEDFVRELIVKTADEHRATRTTLLIDGFPRTREQVHFMAEVFGNDTVDVYHLTCSDEVREQRMMLRDGADAGRLALRNARESTEDECILGVMEELFKLGMSHFVTLVDSSDGQFIRFSDQRLTSLRTVFFSHRIFADVVMKRMGTSMQELLQGAKSRDALPAMHPSVDWTRKFVGKAIEELQELQAALPDAWWSFDEVDMRAARVELIDAFHFMLSASMSLGMGPREFAECFFGKLQVNIKRQSEKYSKLRKTGPDDTHLGKAQ